MKQKLTFTQQAAADIKKARQEAGYTMQSLADQMGVSRQQVTKWESGKENLTADTIERICSAIGRTAQLVIK